MSVRSICITVEPCGQENGDMAIIAVDHYNPEPDYRYQQMILHPAAVSLLSELLTRHLLYGVALEQTIKLNAPRDALADGAGRGAG